MKIIYKQKLLLLCLISLLGLSACKKQVNNRSMVKEGISAGVSYTPLVDNKVDIKGKINFVAKVVSMDDLKEVSANLVEVLSVNSFGNPSSEGNKFFIGADNVLNKQTNSLMEGTVEMIYKGQENFASGNQNEHAVYELKGTIDLSKHKLVKGKRYRLSFNFVTVSNMSSLESPFLFIVN